MGASRLAYASIDRITRQPSAPLDVLLLHGHALALPYLHSPTLCFLVYLSPRAYLSLRRSASATVPSQPASFDIPSPHLHSCLSADPPPIGVTRASLSLVPLPQPPPPPADPLLSRPPSFPLAPTALGFTHNFPLPTGPDSGKYGWVLNFGQGVVMSQSRMLEIARVVQPQDQLSYAGTGPSLSFVTSWMDMLVILCRPLNFSADGYVVKPRGRIVVGSIHGHICAYSFHASTPLKRRIDFLNRSPQHTCTRRCV